MEEEEEFPVATDESATAVTEAINDTPNDVKSILNGGNEPS